MKKDRTKYIYYIIAIGCLILFILILLSSILDIGSKLREMSVYLEYAFYALIILFVIFLIIVPIVTIVKSPSLSIAMTTDDEKTKVAIYKKVAKVIVKNNELPDDMSLMLTSYKNPEELLFNLNYVFEKNIKKQLSKIIISNAKTVLISTAICQNGKFDMMTVFAVNLRMIKQMVLKCGFRPSMKNLSKLTINVFGTALIADGLENLSIEDVLPKSAYNAIAEIPMLGKVLESVTDGVANAVLTLRIGCVTRRYLYNDGAVVTKEEIRRAAYKDTIKIVPEVIAATATFFPKKIIRFFTKDKEKEEVI